MNNHIPALKLAYFTNENKFCRWLTQINTSQKYLTSQTLKFSGSKQVKFCFRYLPQILFTNKLHLFYLYNDKESNSKQVLNKIFESF